MKNFLRNFIYWYAEWRYGAKARGPVNGFRVHQTEYGSMGLSNFTPQQTRMLKKWHWWMNLKNKI